jgi:hypothetical protein
VACWRAEDEKIEFEFTYGVARSIVFPVIKAGVTDFAVTGDWTPATGDTKISLDGGNVGNTSNNPAAVGGTGSALWSLSLTAAELAAKVVVIQIVDSATKAVEDQCIIGYCKDADKIEVYAVEDTDVSPTSTAFQATRGLGRSEEATADHFNGRNILFLSGALQGKMTDITDYALTNSRGAFTVTALGEAPADGDRFVVL